MPPLCAATLATCIGASERAHALRGNCKDGVAGSTRRANGRNHLPGSPGLLPGFWSGRSRTSRPSARRAAVRRLPWRSSEPATRCAAPVAQRTRRRCRSGPRRSRGVPDRTAEARSGETIEARAQCDDGAAIRSNSPSGGDAARRVLELHPPIWPTLKKRSWIVPDAATPDFVRIVGSDPVGPSTCNRQRGNFRPPRRPTHRPQRHQLRRRGSKRPTRSRCS